ncbi:MAG TPA: pyridoxal phosphate-dependent aminotransferase [Kofleriaceae bacterium]|nr:pyridoxal phosphate-dependent aminotransferase [Kofleriaceae bacterium]
MTRLSRRTPEDLAPGELAAAVERARAGGAALCDLSVSNPTEVGLAYPTGALADALAAGAAAPYAPHPRGLESARRAVAALFAARGAPVAHDHVLLTASTSEAYGFLFRLLCDPGDDVLVPAPSYPLLEQLARLEAAEARAYRLTPAPGFALDPDRVEAALGPRTRAVVVVTPNNPTGSVAAAGALAELDDLCAARGVAVISDEVFADYPAAGHAPAPTALAAGGRALTFALGGLSKSCGLPHYKLGWLAAAGPAGARDEALARLDHVADAYLSVATPVMAALPRLLEIGAAIRGAIADRVAANRARAASILGARLLPAAGGWSAVVELPRDTDEDALALRLLARHGVIVQPGYYYDLDRGAHAVVSLLVRPDDLDRGLRALVSESDSRDA